MTTAVLIPPAPTRLTLLKQERDATETAIVALQHRIDVEGGRVPFELRPYLESAVVRLAETEAAIARMEGRL